MGKYSGRKAMTVEFRFPREIEIEFDELTLARQIGEEIAEIAQARLRGGQSIVGESIPRGDDGGRPLYDSGQLIASVQYRPGKTGGRVVPFGKRSRQSKKVRTNQSLMAVLMATRKINPMGRGTFALISLLRDTAAKHLRRIDKRAEVKL